MKIGIYIFRRDLRLNDNLGLIRLQENVDLIIPVFLLDKKQIKKTSNNKNYFSTNAVQFMCESLVNLSNQLSKFNSCLRLFYGDCNKNIKKLIRWIRLNFDQSVIYLGFNSDFSKYSIKRDTQLIDIATKQNIQLINHTDDYTLIPLEKLTKSDKTGFKQFGAFYKSAIKHPVNKPLRNRFNKYLDQGIQISSEFDINNLGRFYQINELIAQNGGRSKALETLHNVQNLQTYNEDRDQLSYQTSNLSAYLNFGCISIRETYHEIHDRLGPLIQILKQLYWRDFYLQALIFIPNGNKYTHMDNRYDKIKWKNSPSDWAKLINCKTGFLIIDAAMNQMKTTGYMHGRARMIVGVFWTKYLLIDIFHPTYGSQVGYSKYLVDAVGPSQNKLNHQWITEFDYSGKKFAPSGVPIAGRPMDVSNRMINKWDKNCTYIKKWLPHLANIDSKKLCRWDETIAATYDNIHPAPMFDSKLKYKEWINACKN
jgi:deoxyribodipyrimidine photo-lyase